jgi:fatty-acyl-CoA synthase
VAASIPAYPPVRGAADLRALERRPLEEWVGGIESGFHGLCRSAAAVPDRAALVFLKPGETEATATLTFAQLLERAERTAAMLCGLGLARSSVVTALLPLVLQAYEVLFGASATGIVSFVNPLLEPGQIAAILRASSTEMLVSLGPGASAEMWAKVEALRGEVPSLRHVLVVDPTGAPVGTQNFDALRDARSRPISTPAERRGCQSSCGTRTRCRRRRFSAPARRWATAPTKCW